MPASAILRLYSCRAKYIFGKTQAMPPSKAEKAQLLLTTNNPAAINKVSNHCQIKIWLICVGIVNF